MPDSSGRSPSDKEISNIESSGVILEYKIPLAVSQTNTTDETTNETTTLTNTTEAETYPPWKPFLVDENLYYPLALVFSALGIFSTLWLIFFVETSKERSLRERLIGSAIRLIIMSLCLGIALHFWILFEPI
ncbi:MAG: hypothetical protein JSV04_09335 [Candidatus Heimdallarchaeota archaeon]|nr:MAG: hypothetical protein JSV04_09335 [Candidatus Heimdallarchaeota archaeon]